ncbi:MAG: glycosyltransferase [Saprospiraceae bacterium]
MQNPIPITSVSMIAYNACGYIGQAIGGVLSQKTNFPFELVIGDDGSTDGTRQICEEYAARYPDIIRLLPPHPNLGIAANTQRTMGSSRGKYIAVCDGDDVWTDPFKLARQVAFLEEHPDYGVVYTDVETISENHAVIVDEEQASIREMYATGDVFFKLLEANFINNSTAMFRAELIRDHIVYPDRCYQIPDYIRWLHIAAQSRVHFMPYKSTYYRKHAAGLSSNTSNPIQQGNRKVFYRSLNHIFPRFDAANRRRLTRAENLLLFRRICSLILRGPSIPMQRLRLLRLLPKYYPGLSDLVRISLKKVVAYFHFFTLISQRVEFEYVA